MVRIDVFKGVECGVEYHHFGVTQIEVVVHKETRFEVADEFLAGIELNHF